MKRKKSLLLTGMCFLAFTSQPAWAETEFSVGLGGSFGADYDGSDDYSASVAPLVGVHWEREESPTAAGEASVSFGLHGAGISMMDGAYLEVVRAKFGNHMISNSIGINYEGGRDEGDNKALRGLGNIDGYVVGTVSLEYSPVEPQSAHFLTGGVDLSFDVSGETDGVVASAGLQLNHAIGDSLVISHGPHVTIANDSHTQAYFGITQRQAANSAYNRYEAEGGLQDAGYSVDVHYGITETIGLFFGGGYSKILGDAADSPLVDQEGDDDQFTAYTGVSYRF